MPLPFLLIHSTQSYKFYKVLAEHLKGNIQLAVGNVVLECKKESDFRVVCVHMRSDITGIGETYKKSLERDQV